jgi:site-specific recombinase XerD
VTAASGFDDTVLLYTQQSIAPSTARTYEAAIRRWKDYCNVLQLDPSPHAMTTEAAANFLASLAHQNIISSNSIRVYRSALSTYFMQGTLGMQGPNPVDTPAVNLLIRGVKRVKQPEEAAKAQPPPYALTITVLESIRSIFLRPDDPQSVMMWAAANLAVYALLRPNEFLGSATYRDRALKPEQIAFFLYPRQIIRAQLLPSGSDVREFELPDRFEIQLGVTKTHQDGETEPVTVAGAPAVEAVWQWLHMRRDLHPKKHEQQLFRVPGSPVLSCAALTSALARAVEQATGERQRLTGKSFRKGGASSLLAAGADRDDIKKAGRWNSGSMIEVYADRQAKQQRKAEVSRSMAPSSS